MAQTHMFEAGIDRWVTVGQGHAALVVGAGGGCLDIFYSHLSFLSSFSLFGRRPDID